MDKDRVEGKLKDIAGRARRPAGEWTGDTETQANGAAKQAEGKIQNALGKAKDRVKNSSPPMSWEIEAGGGCVTPSPPFARIKPHPVS